MIAAFDVHYLENGCASAAAVVFTDYGDAEPWAEYTQFLPGTAAYTGEFYRRELPCILTLIKQINEVLDEMVIDGYVMLGDYRIPTLLKRVDVLAREQARQFF
jgi:deoxyribonuclease V